jgi:hypothetical protein
MNVKKMELILDTNEILEAQSFTYIALYAFHGMTLRQWRDYKIILAHGIKAYCGTAYTSTHLHPQH